MQPETIRHATEADLPEIVSLLRHVFGTGGKWTAEAFHSFYHGDSSYSPEQSQVVVRGGRIVSHVRCSPRSLWVRGQRVAVGAVSSVATLPDCRGRGYARALLRRADSLMRRRGDVLSMLFTDLPSFYEPLGWVSYPQYSVRKHLPKSFRLTGMSRWLPSLPEGVECRRFDSATDLEACRQLHEADGTHFSLLTARPAQWWHAPFSFAWPATMDRYVVATDGAQVLAYVRVLVQGREAVVVDAAPAAAHPSLLPGLLKEILQGARRVSCLSGPVPRGTPLDQALRGLPGRTDECESTGMMLRIESPAALAEHLQAVLAAPRECAAGEVRLTTPAGSVSFSLGRLPKDTTEVNLSSLDLLLLLLGYAPAGRLSFARTTEVPRATVELLEQVFPRQRQCFWNLDQF